MDERHQEKMRITKEYNNLRQKIDRENERRLILLEKRYRSAYLEERILCSSS